MDEELLPTGPLQEFLARLQQTMDRPPNTADPVRGERERLIAILTFLTRFISRVAPARLRKTVNSFLMDQIATKSGTAGDMLLRRLNAICWQSQMRSLMTR